MRYLSVCSGIEAASVAWHPLGWQALAFSEIEPFPRAVLAHHYPDVPLHGDFTVLRDEPSIVDADILVGGTPCQAFSVAGLRNSLADDRGNLTLEFVRLADAIDAARSAAGREPGIVVWENVPGVLSTKDNAFGAFLAGLAGEDTALIPTGGRWTDAGVVDGPCRRIAWRILDAQFFGLAQRRRRVFVVASARDGFDPAAVLLEFEGVRRDTPPRREAGEGTAHGIAPSLTSSGRGVERTGETRGQDPVVAVKWPADLAPTLNAHFGEKQGLEDQHINGGGGLFVPADVTHSLRAEGFDASEDGTGRGTPLVPVYAQELADPITANKQKTYTHEGANNFRTRNVIAFSAKDHGADASEELSPTLRAMPHDASHANGGGQMAVAIPMQEVGTRTGTSTTDPRAGIGIGEDGDPMYTLQAGAQHGVAHVIPFDTTQITSPANYSKPNDGDPCHPLAAGAHPPAVAYAFQPRIARNGRGDMGDVVNALNAQSGETGKGDAAPCVAVAFDQHYQPSETAQTLVAGGSGGRNEMNHPTVFQPSMAVRRLTPVECERLQGFPDGYTNIPWRKQPTAPDGPRYKALGNSMAVPVMRWIGQRIAAELSRASLPRKDHAA